MTEMFGEAWSPMSVPDLAPDDNESGRQMAAILLMLHGEVRRGTLVGLGLSNSLCEVPKASPVDFSHMKRPLLFCFFLS